jgi:cell division protein FtsA
MIKKGDIVVGLDIGTSKICAIVGAMNDEDEIDIIGIGICNSRGLRKGVVVNIESTVDAIKRAIEEAELMAGVDIDSAYVGIAGNHIKGVNSHGIIAIKNKEVVQSDIDRVVDAAKAVAMPLDRQIIHVLSREFVIDEQDGIKEPLGISGVRLEGKVHIVTGSATSVQNVVKCVNKADLEVKKIVLEQLASSEGVLTPDEKELGVALVDIGGGTTDMAVFADGSVKHTSVLPIGGSHITNDIAVGLKTPTIEAEKIKKRYGCALTSLVRDDETVEVPSVGGREPRTLSRKILSEIIEPRTKEMFSLIKKELVLSGFNERVASGVVITGGATIMEGMPELAEQVFELPVRIGLPAGIGGLVDVVNSPMYATGVGLVLYGFESQNSAKHNGSRGKKRFEKVFGHMREAVLRFF